MDAQEGVWRVWGSTVRWARRDNVVLDEKGARSGFLVTPSIGR